MGEHTKITATAEQLMGFALADAWKIYAEIFGEPPHGTAKQLGAMLCFGPAHDIVAAYRNHDALVVALKDAIAECCEHNAEYHHRTSEATLNSWREMAKSSSLGIDESEVKRG